MNDKAIKILIYTHWFWWVDQNETKMSECQLQDLFLWKLEDKEKVSKLLLYKRRF